MARKKEGAVIGFDPLAWMKEPADAPKDVAEDKAPAAPAVAPSADAPAPKYAIPAAQSADVVTLGETLTIEQATGLHSTLCRQLDARQVRLEAGALTRVDAAGMQLLAAFMREAEGRGMTVEWGNPPALLREAARQLGLGRVLRLA